MQVLLEAFIEECCNYVINDQIEKLHILCNKHDLNFKFEKNNFGPNNSNGKITRILFKLNKTNKEHTTLHYLCNGLVIDPYKKIQCNAPPIAFNKGHIFSNINLENYNIYKVIDGTVVTLYYSYKWNISTNNAYDVSGYRWIGEKTYAMILSELMYNLYKPSIKSNGFRLIDNDTAITFDKLDIQYSYTIGFRHKSFHPIEADPECMWNIQKVNLITKEVFLDTGIHGIPDQRPISVSSVKEMLEFNRTALDYACNSNIFHYGYILKSKDVAITKEKSSILLPSTLLQEVKKTLYEYPKIDKDVLNHRNRFHFIVIKNYFNVLDKHEIYRLCPKLQRETLMLSELVNNVIETILMIYQNKKVESIDKKFDILVHKLKNDIKEKINVNEENENNVKSIIRNFVINPQYYLLFLEVFSAMFDNK